MNLVDLTLDALAAIPSAPLWAVLLLKVTLLLGVAWLAHIAVSRLNPRWRVLTWRGAALGLALTVVWTFGLPGVQLRVPVSEAVSAASPVAPVAFDPGPAIPDASLPVDVLPEEALPVVEAPPLPPQPAPVMSAEPAPPEAPFPWGTVFLSIWSLGMAALLARLAVGHLGLSRHLAYSCTPAPDSILAEVRRVAADLGCRRDIRVLQSPKFTVPFIVGVFRPVLVLPERMCHANYAARLPGILAHELSHVRSGDFAWNMILQAVSIPLWFHPLAWRIASAHRAACDAVCDAVSASYLGDVQSYCRTLAKVALEDATSATFPAVGLAMARRCDVRRRVVALERAVFATPLRRRAVAATVAVGLLGAVLLAGVQLTRAEVAAEAEKETTADAPDEARPATPEEDTAASRKRSIVVHVTEPDGSPIGGASVDARLRFNGAHDLKQSRTDEDGVATIGLPDFEDLELSIRVVAEDRVAAGVGWRKNSDGPRDIPPECTVKMEPGTTLGGIVQDEEGRPVSEAKVLITGDKRDSDGVRYREIAQTSKTDENGRWQCRCIPADLEGFDAEIRLEHPRYAQIPPFDLKSHSADELRNETAVLPVYQAIDAGEDGRRDSSRDLSSMRVSSSPDGDTGHADSDRDGRRVVGQFAVPPDSGIEPDWGRAGGGIDRVFPPAPNIPWPEDIDGERTPEAFQKWLKAWRKTPEGERHEEKARQYAQDVRKLAPLRIHATIKPDGSFVVEDVPPGDYQLTAILLPRPGSDSVLYYPEIARLTHKLTVPEPSAERSDEALDLGELILEPAERAAKGAGVKESAPDAAGPKEKTAPEDAKEASKPPTRSMQVLALDPDGKPLADVNITVRAMTDVPHGPDRYQTNEEGIAVIETPSIEEMKSLQILVHTSRRVTVGGVWRSEKLDLKSIPDRFTVTMEPGTAFGGVVRDEAGRPVAGAKVTVGGRKRAPDGVRWWSINDTAETDAEGKWRCERMPADLKGFDVSVRVRHDDYVNGPPVDLKRLSVDELRAGTAVLMVRPGIVVTGTVRDPKGRPLAGALVGLFVDSFWSLSIHATTDEKGVYRLHGCEPGEFSLGVAAEGYAPGLREVKVTVDSKTFDLSVVEGKPIRIRVVDEEGKPLSDAVVGTTMESKELMIDHQRVTESGKGLNLRTDDEGRWSRLWIPEKELRFHVSKDGYEQVEKVFAPRDEEHVVTLRKGGWTIAGRVTNAETGEPVTEFRLVEGYWRGPGEGDVIWRDGARVRNKNGEYRKTWNTAGRGHRAVRVEAEGFLPGEGRPLKVDERDVTLDVKLRPAEAVAGTVRDSEGKPVADVEVFLVTATRGVYIRDGFVDRSQAYLSVRTGPDGKFSLPPQDEPYALLALHEKGLGELPGGKGKKDITIRPWARLEGTFSVRGEPKVDEPIRLELRELPPDLRDLSPTEKISKRIIFHYTAQTDDQGRFRFERVFPGKGRVTRCVVQKQGTMSTWFPTHQAEVEFACGKTTRVDLGREGRTVVGKLTLSDGVEEPADWAQATVYLTTWVAPPPPPPLPTDPAIRDNPPALRAWYQKWLKTVEGKAYQVIVDKFKTRPRATSYYGKVESDGSFRLDDLPPGEYQLNARLDPPASPREAPVRHAIAAGSRVITVPKKSEGSGDEAVDVGKVVLKGVGRRPDGADAREAAPAGLSRRPAAESSPAGLSMIRRSVR